MDPIAIFIGVGVFIALMFVVALLVRIVFRPPGVAAVVKKVREVLAARDVFDKAYRFTTASSAQQVIDAIERRWDRAVPTGPRDFYIESTIAEQQVILLYGNQETPRVFAARIDFESREPASGTLWFFDAIVLSPGTEAADQLRADFARLIAEVSPGSLLEECEGDVTIAAWFPKQREPGHRRQHGHHRRGGNDV